MFIKFDASRSVEVKGNRGYSLKPTIKVFTEAISGSMFGVVNPKEGNL